MENKEAIKYNFEFESDVDWYCKLEDYERYFTYKASNEEMLKSVYENSRKFAKDVKNKLNESKGNLVDCDGSSGTTTATALIHEIYVVLWNWKVEGDNTFAKIGGDIFDCEFGADTYNSVQTTMNQVVKNFASKNDSYNSLKVNRRKYSIGFTLELYNYQEVSTSFKQDLNKRKYLKNYINTYHCIGNFGLVPRGFNVGRGGGDYMDFALKHLDQKGWKENFNTGKNKGADFKRYVNYFFLWDYFLMDGNIRTLRPSSSSEISDERFMEIACAIIERRSTFMVGMLKLKKVIGPDLYSEIRTNVFCEDETIYDSYKCVMCSIDEQLKKQDQFQTEIENFKKKYSDEIEFLKEDF